MFYSYIDLSILNYSQAIRRTVERDHISSDEAKRRINAQLTNQDRFSYANVLLCTYWAESITQKQVEYAWHLLLQRINGNISTF